MTGKPEQELLNSFYDEVKIAEQTIEEYKLDRAARLGIEQAKLRKGRLVPGNRRRWGYAVTALLLVGLAALFVLFPAGSGNPASQAGIDQPPPFVASQLEGHEDWQEAVAHGLYQPINQTEEKNGYRVTIDGVLADNRDIIVFYTTENTMGDKPIVLKKSTVETMNNKPLSGLFTGNFEYETPADKTNLVHNKYEIYLRENYPEDVTPADFKIGGYWGVNFDNSGKQTYIMVPVHLDRSKFAALDKTFPLGQTVNIAGQNVIFNKVVLSPLSSYLDITMPKGGLGSSFTFSNGRIVVKDKDTETELHENMSSIPPKGHSGPWTFSFNAGGYYESNSSVAFKADGLSISSDFDPELIVNTDTGEVIKAPDDNLTAVSAKLQDGKLMLVWKYTTGSKEQVAPQRTNDFYLDNQFKDAKGKAYKLVDSSFLTSNRPGAFYFNIEMKLENETYAQPLTFKILNYPAYIVKDPVVIESPGQ